MTTKVWFPMQNAKSQNIRPRTLFGTKLRIVTITSFIECNHCTVIIYEFVISVIPREGTLSMLGDVPSFWPPFWHSGDWTRSFGGTFSHQPAPKQSFGILKLPIFTEVALFSSRIQNSIFPRSCGVQFSPASGTPSSVFGPGTPPVTQIKYAVCH